MQPKHTAKTTFQVEEELLQTKECRLFLIEGKVQGVWYREATRREAENMGITGHVKNMPDGSVQVLACGEPGSLNRLGEWLKQGPPLAQVERVEWIVSSNQCPATFVVL